MLKGHSEFLEWFLEFRRSGGNCAIRYRASVEFGSRSIGNIKTMYSCERECYRL